MKVARELSCHSSMSLTLAFLFAVAFCQPAWSQDQQQRGFYFWEMPRPIGAILPYLYSLLPKQTNMLKRLLLSYFLFTSINVIAQTGGLDYVKNLGGSQNDMFWSNVLLRNGNLVSVGYTESTDGDAQGNHGVQDCFVVCTSPGGSVLWKKILGGTEWDGYSTDVDTTTDGNIVVGFTIRSSNGDAVGNHGIWDVAFFKYRPDGTLLWSKVYGGFDADILGSLKATPDGGIIAGIASSSSNSGNVSGTSHGLDDLWILKLAVDGSIQWQQLYGGTNNETYPDVALAADGGYTRLSWTCASQRSWSSRSTRTRLRQPLSAPNPMVKLCNFARKLSNR